jgi:hypothetical protein
MALTESKWSIVCQHMGHMMTDSVVAVVILLEHLVSMLNIQNLLVQLQDQIVQVAPSNHDIVVLSGCHRTKNCSTEPIGQGVMKSIHSMPFLMTAKECLLGNAPIRLLSCSNVVAIHSTFWSGNPPDTVVTNSKNREIVSSRLNTRDHCPLPSCGLNMLLSLASLSQIISANSGN